MSIRARAARADAPETGAYVAQLFEQHGRMVHALCRLLLRDGLEAEDAAQQTFLSAHRNLLRGGDVLQPAAWLATIARNECKRRLTRRPPAAVPLSESDRAAQSSDPSRVAEQRAEIEVLSAALAELPQTQREAVILREFYGLSYREVAAALDLSGPAVESVLFKSRRKLQDKLRPLRAASNALVLPLTVHEALETAIPGFSQSAGAGAAAGTLALPAVAKVTAVVATVALGSTVTAVVATRHPRPEPRPAARSVASPRPSLPAPVRRPVAAKPVAAIVPATTRPPERVVARTHVRRPTSSLRAAERTRGRNDGREERTAEPVVQPTHVLAETGDTAESQPAGDGTDEQASEPVAQQPPDPAESDHPAETQGGAAD